MEHHRLCVIRAHLCEVRELPSDRSDQIRLALHTLFVGHRGHENADPDRAFALRKIVEKEIDRSNAAVAGDDKIGSRVSWRFAGGARYPSHPSGIP